MSNRIYFYTQLSSIMEMMVKTTMAEVCKLVDQDSALLLAANDALTEKLNCLECELTTMKSKCPEQSVKCRSIGVQAGDFSTVRAVPDMKCVEWCIDLRKDKEPYTVENAITSSQQLSEFTEQCPDQTISVTLIKEEDSDVEIIDMCPQGRQMNTTGGDGDPVDHEGEELPTERASVLEERMAESEQDIQEHDQLMSSGGLVEHTMRCISLDGIEKMFYPHVIPIEDEEEFEQCIQNESQEELTMEGQGKHAQTTYSETSALSSDETEKNTHSYTETLSSLDTKTFCGVCKQFFPDSNILRTHACLPSKGFTLACQYCGKYFSALSVLNIHKRVHTGERPHTCPICGKGFTQKGNLRCHLRIHTGERPFKCEKCEKSFIQKVQLNQHLISHKLTKNSRAQR